MDLDLRKLVNIVVNDYETDKAQFIINYSAKESNFEDVLNRIRGLKKLKIQKSDKNILTNQEKIVFRAKLLFTDSIRLLSELENKDLNKTDKDTNIKALLTFIIMSLDRIPYVENIINVYEDKYF